MYRVGEWQFSGANLWDGGMDKMGKMGKIVRFPAKKHSSSQQALAAQVDPQTGASGPGKAPWVFSEKDDEAFFHLLREWPCFQDWQLSSSLAGLLRLYYEDKLTLPQDCAIEFMLHMHNPDTAFDIGHALYTWEDRDRDFFMLHLNMHAELIASVRQDEEESH